MSATKWRYGLCANIINLHEYHIIWRRAVQRLYSEELQKDIGVAKITKKMYDELTFHMKNIYGKEITFEKLDRIFYTECILYVAERSFHTHNEKLANMVNRILARIDYKSDTKMSYQELLDFGINIAHIVESSKFLPLETDLKYRIRTWNTISRIFKCECDWNALEAINKQYLEHCKALARNQF